MLLLNEHDLSTCLDYQELQHAMAQALMNYSSGKASNFPRAVFPVKQDNSPMGVMVAVDHDKLLLGYKVITVFHGNHTKQLNPHQGIVACLDPNTGKVQAILDGFFVTAVRTAAVSAVATNYLSRNNSSTLALVGSGTQALEHIKAISKIRPIKRLLIYSRTKESYKKLYHQLDGYPFQEVLFFESPQDAVKNADVVVTCTSSKNTLLSIDDFPKGCHINVVGACRPNEIEVNFLGSQKAKIYLDSYKSCMSESEEVKQLTQNPLLYEQMILGELGSLLNNKIRGRERETDITIFKSVGIAIEDVFAANYFYKKAMQMHIGQQIAW